MYGAVTVGKMLAEILTGHTNREYTSPRILPGPYLSGAAAVTYIAGPCAG
jgi:hypothetical protein